METTITLKIPIKIKEKAQELAWLEGFTMSGYIRYLLVREIKFWEAKDEKKKWIKK